MVDRLKRRKRGLGEHLLTVHETRGAHPSYARRRLSLRASFLKQLIGRGEALLARRLMVKRRTVIWEQQETERGVSQHLEHLQNVGSHLVRASSEDSLCSQSCTKSASTIF